MSTESQSPSTQPSNNAAPSGDPSLPGGREILGEQYDPQQKLRKIIEVEYGPILINDGEKSGLNQLALAAWFASKHQVAFRAMDGSLVQYSDSEGVWHKATKQALTKQIAGMLKELADEVKTPELLEGILAWLIEGYLAHRIELREHGTLKLTPAQQQRVDDWLMESDALRAFATENIKAGVGTITVEEVWTSFSKFAYERHWKVPRKQNFHQDFPAVMFELLGVERDNHIRRMGVEVRGYRGVQFIKEEVQP